MEEGPFCPTSKACKTLCFLGHFYKSHVSTSCTPQTFILPIWPPHHSGCPSLPFGCLSPPSDLLILQFALRNSCQQPGLILSQDGSQQLLPER